MSGSTSSKIKSVTASGQMFIVSKFKKLRRPDHVPALCGAIFIGLGLFLALYTHGRVLRTEWFWYFLIWAIPTLGLWFWKRRESSDDIFPNRNCVCLLIFIMVLSLFSSFVLHKWFYFIHWRPDPTTGGFLHALMTFFSLGSLLLTLIFLFKPKLKLTPCLIILFCLIQIYSFSELLRMTGGEAVYRDDHASFIFRLWEFGRTFPQLVNYMPYWNAGVVDCVGATSGITSIGIPFWPVFKYTDVFSVYTYVLGFVFIILMPWIGVYAARIAGIGWLGSFGAGILSLGVSRHFFLWLLDYGTIGSLFSSFFIVPFSALLYRVIFLNRLELKIAMMLVLSAFFLIQWPPGVLVCAAITISFIINFHEWSLKKWTFLAGCAVATLLFDSGNLWTLLTQGQDVVNYVSRRPHETLPFWDVLHRDIYYLFAHWQEGHPLLIFLGLGGVFFTSRNLKKWYIPISLALIVLVAWGKYALPNLQLGRTAISLFYVSVIPTAFILDRILTDSSRAMSGFRSALMVLMILGGWNVSQIYANRGIERYVTLSDGMKEWVQWIRENTQPDERIMFAGPSIHGFGHGHIAALPILTGREMMGSDYYHFPPDTVEYHYPPRVFRSSTQRYTDFLRLYHVGYVVTFHEDWKTHFRDKMKDVLEEKITIDGKTLFKVRQTSSLFLEGEGTLDADFNRIHVRLSRDFDQVVIRYNWKEGFKSSSPIEIFPFDMGDGVQFIGIRPKLVRDFDLIFKP